LVRPGFNSGWSKVQGIWKPINLTTSTSILDLLPGNYVSEDKLVLSEFGGKGKYRPPEFVWKTTVAPTALTFYNSDKLGRQYENDIFIADYNNGNIYHFELNENRTSLELEEELEDRIANGPRELNDVLFAQGFGDTGGGITDMEVGPDGYLYLLVRTHEGKASIYRIVPQGKSD
jgi:aldose sugar dehydrogenase